MCHVDHMVCKNYLFFTCFVYDHEILEIVLVLGFMCP
jgi:hypothetical protein